MDSRYFLIIIIICFCSISMYMVANSSDVVGSAYVDVGHYTFSLPEGFTLYSDRGNQVSLVNTNSKMQIIIYSDLEKSDNFSHRMAVVDREGGYQLDSNGTINHQGNKIDSAFYHNSYQNRSTFYFSEGDDNLRLLITDFNYNSQKDEVINIASEIIGSIRYNHKLDN